MHSHHVWLHGKHYHHHRHHHQSRVTDEKIEVTDGTLKHQDGTHRLLSAQLHCKDFLFNLIQGH